MTKGAVAGIAVGATLGGILLIAVVAYLIYRCISRRRTDPSTPGAAAVVATAAHQDHTPIRSDNKAELPSQGKQISPSTVSATPVSALDASAGGVSPNTVNASLIPSSMTTTPSPPPAGHPLGPSQHSALSWQGPHSQQQPQMYQAVPSAQGGFIMVPIQAFPGGGAMEIGAPGRDMRPVEVAGGSRQHGLPVEVSRTGPYEMPAPRGN